MNTTAKVFTFIGSGLAIVLVSVLATLGIQSLHKEPPPPPAPVAVVAPPQPQLAQVIGVTPHFEAVQKSSRHCYPTQHVIYTQPERGVPIAGTVIGGLAGGLAGSAIHGRGRNVAIGAGAALGAVTGGIVQNRLNQPQSEVMESLHCSTSTATVQVQKGYDVTYLFNGQQGVTRMDNPPTLNSLIPPPVVYPAGTVVMPQTAPPQVTTVQQH